MKKIRLSQLYSASGTGLGYQISSYIMMRNLEGTTNRVWEVGNNSYKAFRNTFSNEINVVPDYNKVKPDKILSLDDEIGFNELCVQLESDKDIELIELDIYPTPKNITSPSSPLFSSLKRTLTFKDDVYTAAHDFRSKFDGEVIAMHVRRGDFADIANGMFLCGEDYFNDALSRLPQDLPVLIFTNDKDSVISDHALIASDPARFTFVTDLYNDNELSDCDYGQELDRLVDINGNCRFDYKMALAEIVKREMGMVPPYDVLKKEMKRIISELSPVYTRKLKKNLYNYSVDLCLMTMCDHHIISNSTYSLWGTELSGLTKQVVYPKYWMQGHEDDMTLKTDLGDYDQTKDIAHLFVSKPNFQGLANPDPRSFIVVN
jgi:hypothetical protein